MHDCNYEHILSDWLCSSVRIINIGNNMKTDRTQKISAVNKKRCRTNLRSYADENFHLTMNLAQYLRLHFLPRNNQYLRIYTHAISSRSNHLLLKKLQLLCLSGWSDTSLNKCASKLCLEDLTRLYGIFGVSKRLNQKSEE